MKLNFYDYIDTITSELIHRFDVTYEQAEEIIDYYAEDIADGWSAEKYYPVDKLVNGWITNGILSWKRLS